MAMQTNGPRAFRNVILSSLSPSVRNRLPLEPIDLPVRFVLYEPNQPIEHAYFPEEGIVSVVSLMENGSSIEVGTIGREGLACSVLLLNVKSVPYRYFIQVGGHGHRISAREMLATAGESEEFRSLVLGYEAIFRTQTMQGMACNGLHSIEQRCCRWILMTRDRCDTDDLYLTHEFLSLMLGVRRSSVSEVLAPLQDAGLIRSNRGIISILDRPALESRVCECYWVMMGRERPA